MAKHNQRVVEKLTGALREAEAKVRKHMLERQKALAMLQAMTNQAKAVGRACASLHAVLEELTDSVAPAVEVVSVEASQMLEVEEFARLHDAVEKSRAMLKQLDDARIASKAYADAQDALARQGVRGGDDGREGAGRVLPFARHCAGAVRGPSGAGGEGGDGENGGGGEIQ